MRHTGKHDDDGTYDCDGCGKPYPMDEVHLVRSSQGQTTQCGWCLGWWAEAALALIDRRLAK